MIIDSGSDFLLLALPHLWQPDSTGRTVVSLALDDDMGLCGTRVVTSDYGGELDEIATEILESVDQDYVRYFAIAQESRHAENHLLDYDATKRLADTAASRGLHLISHLYVTPDSWCSTGPMYTFSSYMMGDELPRVTVQRPAHYSERRRVTNAPLPQESVPPLGKVTPVR